MLIVVYDVLVLFKRGDLPSALSGEMLVDEELHLAIKLRE
jgi:hypothetical protein